MPFDLDLDHPALPVPEALAAEQFAMVLRRMADDLTYGIDPSRFFGAGTDYAQSRLYQRGDAVRSIDWRVTARSGKVHVKDFDSTKRSGVVLVVDTSASMAVSSEPLSKHDVAIWIAGTLAMVGLKRRSPVSVFAGGNRVGLPPIPSLSRGKVWAQIDALRQPAEGERGGEGTVIIERLKRIEATLHNVSSICVISDLHEEGVAHQLKRLAQRHDVTAIQLQDPIETRPIRAGLMMARGAEHDDGEVITGAFACAPVEGELATLPAAGVRHAVISTAFGGREVMPGLRKLFNARSAARGAR